MNQKYNRAEALQIGLELFHSQGYNTLGVNEIIEKTGMTKGAFYNAFKSKENFLLEGMKKYGEDSSCIQKKLLNPPGNKKAIEILRGFYDQMLDKQSKMNNSGCLVMNMMSEMGTQNDGVRQATVVEFNKFIKTIEPTVRQAQSDGDLKGDIDSMSLTELIHTTFIGSLILAKGLKYNTEGKKTMKLLIDTLEP